MSGSQDAGRKSDRLGVVLGTLAVKRQWITSDQLREALAEQGRDFAEGRHPRTLSDILLTRGNLTPHQVRALELESAQEVPATEPPPEEGPLGPGADFAKYRIVRVLGKGGMATVYEALDPQLERRVALKVLRSRADRETGEGPQEEERFLREARLSANIPKHPHLVGVYEAGVWQGRRYIAAEYVEGDPADDWKIRTTPDLRRQVTLLRDVAAAIHHAHEHGVLHRDLKPQNVLVDASDQPHITDFGLAKAMLPERENTALTAAGMTVGTPAYMSPEQAQGRRDLDRRTDVYSLGVMLYEAIANQVPFSGETGVEIMIKASRDPLPKPSTVRRVASLPPVDAVLERICLKAMARRVEDRTASAQIFALHLSQWLKGEKVTVSASGSRPVRALVGGLAAGALLALAVVLAAPWSRKTPVVLPPAPPEHPAAPAGLVYAGKNAQGYHEYRHLKDDALMILVPEGEFWRGADAGGDRNERPRHRVHLDAFLIDKHEVTVRQFRAFVESTGYVTEAERGEGAFIFRDTQRIRDPKAVWKTPSYAAADDLPVTCVSWKDAAAYCAWAGKRLPTEAEWEKAARGTDGRTWPWGNEWDPARANAERRLGRPAPVGAFPLSAGPYGVLDASGNVTELCADWMDEELYGKGQLRNPTGPAEGQMRILKGGSWWDRAHDTRLTRRLGRPEKTIASSALGFRAARDAR